MKATGETFGTGATAGRGSMVEQTLRGGGKRMSKIRPNKDPAADKALGAFAASYGGDEQLLARGDGEASTGTSIFDPVLCELAYLWFCPPKGHVLDPFAGGSVRGIVAGFLGRAYTGIELRPEQVEANRAQLRSIKPKVTPTWVEGDAHDVQTLASAQYDLVFTCPPYGDLERYSDNERDVSTMAYPDFIKSLRLIVSRSLGMLKEDRFAAIVVGDFRDKKGFYRNFVSDTIAAFQDAGAKLYNEAILVTAVGSLSIRAGRQFAAGRKLGKTHQQFLVFCKGDPAKAAKACGKVNVSFDVEASAPA
jgi:predicted RNA methylase